MHTANAALRNYTSVTAAYWVFTLTDGALRMLVAGRLHLNSGQVVDGATRRPGCGPGRCRRGRR